jgi:hypothetical protein
VSAVKRGTCESCCVDGLVCLGCDDTRPKADEVQPGWAFQTPLGAWETVARVDIPRGAQYGAVSIYTRARPDFGWRYNAWVQVDAAAPHIVSMHDTPEVRAIVGKNDLRMYAVATVTGRRYGWTAPRGGECLAEAGNGGRGVGWWVVTEGGGDVDKREGLTKAQARSEIKRRAKAFAKALKVPYRETDD